MSICRIVDCGAEIYAKKLCRTHYNRIRRTGSPISEWEEQSKPKYVLPVQLTRQELIAWAAGFFDGEGYIHPRQGKTKYSLALVVSQCELSSLQRMQGLFGGSIYAPESRRNAPRRKPNWQWYAGNKRAKLALNEMLPYLTVKHERAVEVLDLLK